MKRTITLISVLVLSILAFGQPPAGYYDSAQGLYGQNLKMALYNIIKFHSSVTYSQLWTEFPQTDATSTNKVWDIYSDNPAGVNPYTYSFSVNQCGTYSQEGDCYNREHVIPQSSFGGALPMYTDLFHIYPVDGYVNNRRADYAFGTVGSVSWTSANGGKLGTCNYPGYTGSVFEPIDEYKGDIARSIFYMMTCYQNQVQNWSSVMLSGNDLAPWFRDMLVSWSANDPVSQKEIDRNNAIYAIQNNRNPFIDEPYWVESIWGVNASVTESKEGLIDVWFYQHQLHVISDMKSQVMVYDLSGKLVESNNNVAANAILELDQPVGIYIVKVLTNTQVYQEKVFVR